MDIAIIGGGMAGLSAGLYAARAGMQTVLFEQFMPGGNAANILKLENYPGFSEGVDGATLMTNTARQAEAAGCELRYEGVERLVKQDGKYAIITSRGKYQATAVIIAGGAIPRKLGVARENELTGRGISYCATCDGALFRNKVVSVVGGGNTALTDALVLARFASRVHLVHRRDQFRGSQVLQDRVKNTAQIELHLSQTVTELLGGDKLKAIVLHDKVSGLERELKTDGLFVAVGYAPMSELVHDLVELDAAGAIVTDKHLQTTAPGIFAAGDCRDTVLRQVITAAADGAIAGVSAAEYAANR